MVHPSRCVRGEKTGEPAWVSRDFAGLGGYLTDCNMVGVAIGSFFAESEDNVRPEGTYDTYRIIQQRMLVDILQLPVTVVEAPYVLNSQFSAGGAKLLPPIET